MGFFSIPKLRIGELEISLIQGGMGVGISGASLASAVANQGGAGIIAAVGLNEAKGYTGDYVESSSAALRDEILKARSKTSGIIGVNIMHVLSNYSSLVETSIQENVDLIISGAGIPRDMPRYLRKDSKTKLIPIVSSARLASMICKAWKAYNHLPDAIIVEGPKAGGHLGYSHEQLLDKEFVANGLENIVAEVLEITKRKIPIIAAGGIFYGGDIKKFLDIGAAGVQMATRFVTTYECDAPQVFKDAYLKCSEEDLRIIRSPVGMPGRAITNKFLEEVESGKKIPFACPYHCLKPCDIKKSPYCIARALVQAKKGNLENGFVFAGSNAYLCKKIVSVREVFEDLEREYLEGKTSAKTLLV